MMRESFIQATTGGSRQGRDNSVPPRPDSPKFEDRTRSQISRASQGLLGSRARSIGDPGPGDIPEHSPSRALPGVPLSTSTKLMTRRWKLAVLAIVGLSFAVYLTSLWIHGSPPKSKVAKYFDLYAPNAVTVNPCVQWRDPDKSVFNAYWCDVTASVAVDPGTDASAPPAISVARGRHGYCFVVGDADRALHISVGSYPYARARSVAGCV